MEIWIACITTAVIASCLAGALVLSYRRKLEATMETMNRMLDSAAAGEFHEAVFDESMVSSIETKLAHFLSANQVSEKKLKDEQDKIKELISDISHQTKTPLANILLYAQLLSEQELQPQSRECVTALNAQAEKLSFLIGQLVRSSWMETGILTPLPKQGNVLPMLSHAIGQIRPKADAKGIILSLTSLEGECTADNAGTTDELTAEYDEKWTEEAVFNLLDNGVKYTPEGGHIAVRVTPYEMFCRIDITDDGIGIQEEEHARIFKRFYRSPGVSSTEGLGIGLFLTRQIITAQSGYIKVTSEPGKGSTFSVFLPQK